MDLVYAVPNSSPANESRNKLLPLTEFIRNNYVNQLVEWHRVLAKVISRHLFDPKELAQAEFERQALDGQVDEIGCEPVPISTPFWLAHGCFGKSQHAL